MIHNIHNISQYFINHTLVSVQIYFMNVYEGLFAHPDLHLLWFLKQCLDEIVTFIEYKRQSKNVETQQGMIIFHGQLEQVVVIKQVVTLNCEIKSSSNDVWAPNNYCKVHHREKNPSSTQMPELFRDAIVVADE